MPVTSPQGTLDFKKVDKITFVGASSNTVIDTTTGSVGIGVVGDALSSNLHVVGDTRMEGNINMLHTSNTASIKLNSNVVTEFPRSKKLIKYPRVALTSGQSGLGDGYTQDNYNIQVSTEWTNTLAYAATYAVDNKFTTTSWVSGQYTYSTDGTAENATTPDEFQDIKGSWINIQLPDKIVLDHFTITNRDSATIRNADSGILWAKNKTDSTWFRLHDFSGLNTASTATNTIHTNQTIAYDEYRLQITKIEPYTGTPGLSIGEWQLFGVPEYDPEADGTDVVVKSVPNVPNTDWLEVYYDAKDLGDGVVTNPISGLGGTTNNGTAYGNTQISGGAFVFDGNGDYIETTVTTETGSWPHSYSFWMKADTDASSGAHFVALGTEGGSGSGTSVIRFSNDNVLWYFWSNDVTFKASNLRGRWVHVVGTYDGGSAATSRKIFINNIEAPISSTAGTISSLNLTTTSTPFKIGSKLDNTSTFKGSIANVRLFNRALTSDEIYQLYAYQKEYFGHSTNSMTLKAGRLGIGTSEPKAALDVRGFIKNESAWFYAYDGDAMGGTENNNAGTFNNYTGFVPFNKLKPGSKYFTTSNTTSGGYFTAPCDGIYHFDTSVLNYPDARSGITEIFFSVNDDTNVTNSYGYIRKTNMPTQHCIMTGSTFRLSEGDSVKVYVINIDLYTDSYIGIFSGYLVTML